VPIEGQWLHILAESTEIDILLGKHKAWKNNKVCVDVQPVGGVVSSVGNHLPEATGCNIMRQSAYRD
jgi:hypothetical protein